MADIVSIVTAAEAITEALIKAAPAIESGIASAAPFVEAIITLAKSGNAPTPADFDALQAMLDANSAAIQAVADADKDA